MPYWINNRKTTEKNKQKNMKKLMMMTAAVLMATFFTTPIFAQGPPADGGDKGEKIEALRIAFITQELQLTPQEAQKFWPVYKPIPRRYENAARQF
jgi:Spy/CpxP family protein refolding chaperone